MNDSTPSPGAGEPRECPPEMWLVKYGEAMWSMRTEEQADDHARTLPGALIARYTRAPVSQLGEQRPTVVCLCGSTRFMDAYQAANLSETIAGRIVLSIGCNTKSDTDLIALGQLTPEAKDALDELHKRKIDLADEILVLNVGGYVGKSTRSEIEYAEKLGKRIRWLESETAAKREESVAAAQTDSRQAELEVTASGESVETSAIRSMIDGYRNTEDMTNTQLAGEVVELRDFLTSRKIMNRHCFFREVLNDAASRLLELSAILGQDSTGTAAAGAEAQLPQTQAVAAVGSAGGGEAPKITVGGWYEAGGKLHRKRQDALDFLASQRTTPPAAHPRPSEATMKWLERYYHDTKKDAPHNRDSREELGHLAEILAFLNSHKP